MILPLNKTLLLISHLRAYNQENAAKSWAPVFKSMRNVARFNTVGARA